MGILTKLPISFQRLDQIADMLPETDSSAEDYAAAFLDNQDVFPSEIAAHPELRSAIIKAAKDIAEFGVLTALSPITRLN